MLGERQYVPERCHTCRTTSVSLVKASYSGFQCPSHRSYLRSGLGRPPKRSCPAQGGHLSIPAGMHVMRALQMQEADAHHTSQEEGKLQLAGWAYISLQSRGVNTG